MMMTVKNKKARSRDQLVDLLLSLFFSLSLLFASVRGDGREMFVATRDGQRKRERRSERAECRDDVRRS